MADSYSVLKGKYQRALVSIRELTQREENAKQEIDDIKERHKLVDKNVRYLCETILKKNRGDSKEKNWREMKMIEMIRLAQESIEKYFVANTNQIQQLLDINQERTKDIMKLEKEKEEISRQKDEEYKEKLEQKDSLIEKYQKRLDEVTLKLDTGVIEKEELDAIKRETEELALSAGAEKPDLDMGVGDGIGFEVAEEDGLDDLVTDVARNMLKEETKSKPNEVKNKGPRIHLDRKSKQGIDQAKKEADADTQEKVKAAAGKLSDAQKLCLRVMGETGSCEQKKIISAVMKQYPQFSSSSKVQPAFFDLSASKDEESKVLKSFDQPIPGSPHFKLYQLTDLGISVYRYLFQKDPVESEVEEILRNHTSLDHGYGIRQTAELFKTMPYFINQNAEIEYLTRSKEYTVRISDKLSYIPDIVVTYEKEGKKKMLYYEYETGSCADADFFAKCNKMASFLTNIDIIVPNVEAKAVTAEKIQKWRKKVQEGVFKIERPVNFHLASYNDIRSNRKSKRFPWAESYSVSPPGYHAKKRENS